MKIYWKQNNIPALRELSIQERRAAKGAVLVSVWKHWQVWLPHVALVAGFVLFWFLAPQFPYRLFAVVLSAYVLFKLASLPTNSYLQYHLSQLGYGRHKKRSTNALGFHPLFLTQICQPKTVIDVGVGHGTFALYEAFPKARFVLVEPLRDFQGAIENIAKKYNCDVFYKAVSNAPGTQEISVDTKDLHKSSISDRTPLTQTGNQIEKRVIEVTTLDEIFRETPAMQEPILLKIDTEGHELKALQGAQSLLRVTEIVIVEVSIARRFEESYEFEDIILFMKESGFYLLTFLNLGHSKGELRTRFADIVFKRRHGTDGTRS